MYCYYNKDLYDDVRYNYREVVVLKFWKYIYPKYKTCFDKVLSEIWKLRDKVVKYISKLSQKQ